MTPPVDGTVNLTFKWFFTAWKPVKRVAAFSWNVKCFSCHLLDGLKGWLLSPCRTKVQVSTHPFHSLTTQRMTSLLLESLAAWKWSFAQCLDGTADCFNRKRNRGCASESSIIMQELRKSFTKTVCDGTIWQRWSVEQKCWVDGRCSCDVCAGR